MNKQMILTLVDKVIKVDRGGPESRVGKLVAAAEDHITLLTENDGIIFYNTHHIKSITDNVKNEIPFNLTIPKGFEFIKAKNFKEVLEKLKYKWVKINRGGPETLEGVMEDVQDEFVTIVANDEVIRLSMFHIRNISYGLKIEKEKVAGKSSDKEEKTASSEERKEK